MSLMTPNDVRRNEHLPPLGHEWTTDDAIRLARKIEDAMVWVTLARVAETAKRLTEAIVAA